MIGTKFETTVYKVLSVLFLAVFLPVLFCVFTVAARMDYFEAMKPQTMLPNFVLFLLALPFGALIVFLLSQGEKHPLKGKWDYLTGAGLAVLAIGLYFVMNSVAREAAFFLPWDIDVVRGSALNFAALKPMGYDFYYSIYSNNIPIVFILGKILKFSKEWGYPLHPEFILVQVNCALMAASVLFAALSVKRLTKNLAASLLTFALGTALIASSGWMMAVYTDTYGQLFPILGVYLYICYRQVKPLWAKLILMFGSIGVIAFGGLVKPSIFVVLIALIMAECVRFTHSAIDFIAEKKASPGKAAGNKPFLTALICMLAFLSFSVALYKFSGAVKTELMNRVGLEFNANLEAGPADYLLMGQNNEHTGAYLNEDTTIFGEFQDTERSVREKIIFGRAMDRIKDRGLIGNLSFYLRKMVMTFNDGTFGWSTEVWKNGDYNPTVARGGRLSSIIKQFYDVNPNRKNGFLNTFQHFIWMVCLIGLGAGGLSNFLTDCKSGVLSDFLTARESGGKKDIKPAGVADANFLMIIFFGVYFYQMLFEARARYLFVFLPVLMVMAMQGYANLRIAAQRLFAGKHPKGETK
ncbi:MAG: hypothetical protein IKP92_08170 [Lachnospiraceae bacterium]|nr:hypothetical protein [Lachnospiraceae bacterium]